MEAVEGRVAEVEGRVGPWCRAPTAPESDEACCAPAADRREARITAVCLLVSPTTTTTTGAAS